ncbi:MAG: adenosylhomocysteinase [Solirubrobacterales bacterium]
MLSLDNGTNAGWTEDHSGLDKIRWAASHMPVLGSIRQECLSSRPLAGIRIAICLHLEAKTAVLALVLRDAGADVAACASNPLSTQDDIVDALQLSGLSVFARRGQTAEEYTGQLDAVLDTRPHLIIDDGQDLVARLHTERRDVLDTVIGGCEETTTGIQRLKALEREGALRFPMIAVNDARMKNLFDNRYGTGQSVWDAILRTTNLTIAGRTVVVAGYGWCGKGVSRRAAGLGARVIVTEIDPVKANEALMDGFDVMPMIDAAPLGDFFITVTGNIDVIRMEHLQRMKDGALLANAGHFDVEISLPDLAALAAESREVRPNIMEYVLPNRRRLHLLAAGRLVNLVAGDGHPVEVMDLSFALQALCVLYLARQGQSLAPAVYPVPEELDLRVARERLAASKVRLDHLSGDQADYLDQWK